MNIAILGYGIEGESVYNYYRAKFPDATITAYDNKEQPKNSLPADVEFVGGVKDFKNITADLAIKTPAIAPWLVEVSGEVTTATREFMQHCPAPIIGVTGTKGKGTTASLIKSILDAAGKKTWLVGNIGVGALDVLDQITPEDIVVYELSSFQLWDLDVSPYIAVVSAIEPEHLDVHKDFDDYLTAKANIAAHQSADDIVIYRANNKYATNIAMQSSSKSFAYPHVDGAHVMDGRFFYGAQELCSVDNLKILGIYNQDNACAAIEAVRTWVKDGDIIARGLSSFKGLPHRLQLVKIVDDVSYYDDSVGTTPSSAIAVLESFDVPKVMILGGYDKGADYKELVDKIIASDSMRSVITIGVTGKKIAELFDEKHAGKVVNRAPEGSTMRDIVKMAQATAQPGDVVLLSPASASFDMFKNIYDRGDQFIAAVNNL